MFKKLVLLCLLMSGMHVFAADIPVTVTPLKKISTTDKHLVEGDVLEFKEISSNRVITGVVKDLTPNGFAGQEASMIIDTFKFKDSGEPLNCSLYLKGGEHKTYQEFANNTSFGISIPLIRGGEIILEPEVSKIVLVPNESKQASVQSVKIKPAQKISTCYDEIEVGDKIKFSVVKDVYKTGELYIKKDTPIYGIVDYISENGWTFDSAEIDFKYFKTKNIDGKTVTIESPASINGFEILKNKGNRTAQFFNYLGILFRGKEIELIPEVDDFKINLWMKN